ncbi:MAG: GlsB/YeaQ/YmgE family stress response membrane protein [Actinomycetaceae bacterium]|nr:GlsB/YeaQ/YmgE family stress response membrane protein [Actinomycetaceae bacterium]
MELIGTIIFGGVIGALARIFMKGEQNIGMLWTIILGALGAGIASFLLERVWPNALDTPGIDWIRWIVSILVAMGLITAYMKLRGTK